MNYRSIDAELVNNLFLFFKVFQHENYNQQNNKSSSED